MAPLLQRGHFSGGITNMSNCKALPRFLRRRQRRYAYVLRALRERPARVRRKLSIQKQLTRETKLSHLLDTHGDTHHES